MIFKRRKINLEYVRIKRQERESVEQRRFNCHDHRDADVVTRRRLWAQHKHEKEEIRRANHDTVELKVTPNMKIYGVLNKPIYYSNDFCDDTKRYCWDKSIAYVGQLVQKFGCEM